LQKRKSKLIGLGAWGPSTPLRERLQMVVRFNEYFQATARFNEPSQTKARLLSGVKALLTPLHSLIVVTHPPCFYAFCIKNKPYNHRLSAL